MVKINQVRQPRHRRNSTSEVKKKLIILGSGFFFLVSCLGIGSYIFFKGLKGSDFFQITSIKIDGQRRTSKKNIMDLSGVDIHTNLLALNVNKVKAKVVAHDWIESAEIDRHWPNRLVITVKERTPVAIVSLNSGLYYLDRKGVAFAKVLPPEDMDYPVITGQVLNKWSNNIKGTPLDKALRFIRYSSRGNSILPKQSISEVHLTDDGDMILFLVNRPFPIYLGKEKIGTQYYRLAKVLYWLYKKKEFSKTAYIRMDYIRDKVLVGKIDSNDVSLLKLPTA